MGKKDVMASVLINRNLWKEAKKYAIDNDTTLKELLINLLKLELKENIVKKKLAEERRK